MNLMEIKGGGSEFAYCFDSQNFKFKGNLLSN